MSEDSKQTFSMMIDAMGPIYVQYASWMKMQKLEKEIQAMQANMKPGNFKVLLENEVYKACLNQTDLIQKISNYSEKTPKIKTEENKKPQLKEAKRCCAKLVLDDTNETVVQEITESTQLPIIIGREGRELKEQVTFVNLRPFTDARTVSHRHAKIDYDAKNGAYTLLSLGRNGTHVDGEAHVQEQGSCILNDRAEISIGSFRMFFIYC